MQLERASSGSRSLTRPVLEDEPSSQPRNAPSGDPTGRLLHVLWERRWIVVTAVVLCLIGGIIYLANATPVFASGSRILVQQSTPRLRSDELVGGETGSTFLADQMELIRSPAILSAASTSPTLKESKLMAGVANPVGLLLGMVSVNAGKQSDVLTVSAESTDPYEAASAVNAVVDAYVAYEAQQQHSTAAEVLKVLEKEKANRDNELDQISKRMMEFKQDNHVLTFENDRGNIVNQRLSELSEEVNAADTDLLNAKLLKDSIAAVGDDPHKIKQLMEAEFAKGVQINVAQDSSDDALQLKKLKAQLGMLTISLGTENKQVLEARQEMEALRVDLAEADKEAAADSRDVVDQIYTKTQKKADALHEEFDKQQVLAVALAGKSAEYAKLEMDERRLEKDSDLLDSRIKDINVSDDVGSFSASILDVAKASSSPVRPVHEKVLGEALVAGLMLGLGLAMLRDRMDQRLRSVDEISSLLDLEVLGLVPSMPTKQSRSERGQLVHTAPRSPVAESYRTIRTGLYFGTSSARLRTLLVTSPSPGDGKSTMASNLAIAMAQAGERVLLLDADCRRPTQHKIFGLKNDMGLSNVLQRHASLEDAIQSTDIANLFVMPCGPIPANPSEVLNSNEFHQLVSTLSSQYDRVVFDSPPVMPVTDARILAASCDAAILVLRAEQSNRRLGMLTVEALRSVGANILGAVLNDVSLGRGRYSYYVRDRYHMQYYGSEKPMTSDEVVGEIAETNGEPEQIANGASNGLSEPAETV